MDMNAFVPHWINNASLRQSDGRYAGTIAEVAAQAVRNPYTGQKAQEPVIEFEDGARYVPNISMRRELMARYGSDTDRWVGKRLTILLHTVQRTDRKTGEMRERVEKRLVLPDVDSNAEVVPAWVTEDDAIEEGNSPEPGEDEFAKYEPSPFLRKARR